jgi:hypothetical protein
MSKSEFETLIMLCEFWLEYISQEDTDRETYLEVVKLKEWAEGSI